MEDEEAAIRKERNAKEEETKKKKRKKAIIEGVIEVASFFIPTPQPRLWTSPDDKA